MTTSPRITLTAEGRAYLHIWRTGQSYARQKEALYRREWTNVLFSMLPQPADEHDVLYHDVRKPLPFADKTFDSAYALHIIEHLTPGEAVSMVNELYRVLKPGGILRISTPDLEDICRSYLRQLDECRTSRSDLNMVRYRWAVLELLDQIVREQSGGMMAQASALGDFDPEFARRRFGDVFDEFSPSRSRHASRDKPLLKRLARVTASSLIASVQWRAIGLIDRRYRIWLRTLMSAPRHTGELNKWMYDELSLETLLEAAGFREHRRQDHTSSMIPDWNRYALDQSTGGAHAIEPSLYFEARKPS
jgi:SAM-dependent methyltransferase